MHEQRVLNLVAEHAVRERIVILGTGPHVLEVVITITFYVSGRVSLQTIAEPAIDEPVGAVYCHVTNAIIMVREKRADSVALRRGVAFLERRKPEVFLKTRKVLEQDFG